jgi:hypothetical protein
VSLSVSRERRRCAQIPARNADNLRYFLCDIACEPLPGRFSFYFALRGVEELSCRHGSQSVLYLRFVDVMGLQLPRRDFFQSTKPPSMSNFSNHGYFRDPPHFDCSSSPLSWKGSYVSFFHLATVFATLFKGCRAYSSIIDQENSHSSSVR